MHLQLTEWEESRGSQLETEELKCCERFWRTCEMWRKLNSGKFHSCSFTGLMVNRKQKASINRLDPERYSHSRRLTRVRPWVMRFVSRPNRLLLDEDRTTRRVIGGRNSVCRNRIHCKTSTWGAWRRIHSGRFWRKLLPWSCKLLALNILGNADVNDEKLMSAFIGADALLPSRPLTCVSFDPHDRTALTRNHFLRGP